MSYLWGITRTRPMIFFFIFIFVCLVVAGYGCTLQLYYRYKSAYERERFLHTQTLLECRGLYEEMNRHLRRNGLGELPNPELLERETIKRLNDETNLYLDPSLRVVGWMQRKR